MRRTQLLRTAGRASFRGRPPPPTTTPSLGGGGGVSVAAKNRSPGGKRDVFFFGGVSLPHHAWGGGALSSSRGLASTTAGSSSSSSSSSSSGDATASPPPGGGGGGADFKERDITGLDATFSLQQTLENVAGPEATASLSGAELMYQPPFPDNWEELLAEARASYPPRDGKRRSKHKRRFRNQMRVIAKQHRVLRQQRIDNHYEAMLERSRKALERRGWFGPVLRA